MVINYLSNHGVVNKHEKAKDQQNILVCPTSPTIINGGGGVLWGILKFQIQNYLHPNSQIVWPSNPNSTMVGWVFFSFASLWHIFLSWIYHTFHSHLSRIIHNPPNSISCQYFHLYMWIVDQKWHQVKMGFNMALYYFTVASYMVIICNNSCKKMTSEILSKVMRQTERS